MNNVFIGIDAGLEMPPDCENIVIIGDGIKSLSHHQKNVLFIGKNVAIGETLLGEKINLKEVIAKHLQ